MTINPQDLRIDIYRNGSPDPVNDAKSQVVTITRTPSGIVVNAKTRLLAMRKLRARLGMISRNDVALQDILAQEGEWGV